MTGPKRAIDRPNLSCTLLLNSFAVIVAPHVFFVVSLKMVVSKSVEKNKVLFANLYVVNPSRQRALLAHLRAVISSHVSDQAYQRWKEIVAIQDVINDQI